MADLWTQFAAPWGRQLWGQRLGNAAVEMALIAPLLVTLLIGMADYGTAIHRRMQVQHAAQAGADFAMRNGFSSAAIATAVTNATTVAGLSATPLPVEGCGCASAGMVVPAVCALPCASGEAAGTYVTVSAQATHTTLLPYPGIPSSFTFTATSMTRVR
jgi:Flp pilus assembly protein TadG